MVRPDFGQLMQSHCKRSGLSLRDLSGKIGLSHATTGHWSRGERCPPPDQVEAIINALSLDVREAQEFRAAAASAHIPEGGLRQTVEHLEMVNRNTAAALRFFVDALDVSKAKRDALADLLEHDVQLFSDPASFVKQIESILSPLGRAGSRKRS